MRKKKFKHFDNVQSTLSYVTSELTNTLEDDRLNLGRGEGEQKKELAKKIDDITVVTPLIEAAPDLYKALVACEAKLRYFAATLGHGVLRECIDARAVIELATVQFELN